MITPEQHAEIRRLYYGEHWKVGTIAAALGVHYETVRAAIVNNTQGVRRGTCRATASASPNHGASGSTNLRRDVLLPAVRQRMKKTLP
jgi:hypothetical protein